MTILVVDKNKSYLDEISGHLEQLCKGAEICTFSDSPGALAAARKKRIDVAYLEDDLPELNGFLLGQYLKDLYPTINLILMTKEKQKAFEAMALRASGCILLPPKDEDIETEQRDLRYPVGVVEKSRVFVQTFGNFEFFVDGIPVQFKYSKTKEILAVLINNKGVQTTNGEIIACLWEDDGDPKVKSSYLSNLRQDLQNTLSDLGISGIIIKQRGSMAIARDLVKCDLYEWLDKKKMSSYQYLGDYMNQFSWAEYVHAELDEIVYAEDE